MKEKNMNDHCSNLWLNVTYLTKGPGPSADVQIAAHIYQPIITLDVLLYLGIQWQVHWVI